MTTTGHIYAILPREFNATGEGVLKVGRSTCIDKRCVQYPKGSTLIYSRITTNCILAEEAIIQALLRKQSVTHRKDIGREYFQGNFDDIIETIEKALCSFKYNDILLNTSTADTARNNEMYAIQFYDERLCHVVKNSCMIPYADMLKLFYSFTEEDPKKIKLTFEFMCEALRNIYSVVILDNTQQKYFRFPSEKSPIIDWLLDNYIITQNSDDIVSASDLYTHFCKTTNDSVSVTTFGITLHKLCGIPRKQIRRGQTTMAAYFGIKKME
jgi:hypothetical protein